MENSLNLKQEKDTVVTSAESAKSQNLDQVGESSENAGQHLISTRALDHSATSTSSAAALLVQNPNPSQIPIQPSSSVSGSGTGMSSSGSSNGSSGNSSVSSSSKHLSKSTPVLVRKEAIETVAELSLSIAKAEETVLQHQVSIDHGIKSNDTGVMAAAFAPLNTVSLIMLSENRHSIPASTDINSSLSGTVNGESNSTVDVSYSELQAPLQQDTRVNLDRRSLQQKMAAGTAAVDSKARNIQESWIRIKSMYDDKGGKAGPASPLQHSPVDQGSCIDPSSSHPSTRTNSISVAHSMMHPVALPMVDLSEIQEVDIIDGAMDIDDPPIDSSSLSKK